MMKSALTRKSVYTLPTIMSSFSSDFGLKNLQISNVKRVEEELKIDVKDDIKAASTAANIRPRKPTKLSL